MKYLLFFVFLFPLGAQAQKDFDYTIFTTKSGAIIYGDTVDLSLLRVIEKRGDEIVIRNANDPSSFIKYSINFVGVSYETGCPALMYKIKDMEDGYIFVSPIEPTVYIISEKDFFKYY